MDDERPRRLERMRRDSVRQPKGDANRPGAERPAVLETIIRAGSSVRFSPRLAAPTIRYRP